ncbi:dethiobiotin synthase [Bartonella sp. DGB2]|uniref:dethiobiotin synthase n=1 Tax=Bartonella sp. DGB2 TaxID=3388426 RepID=UPI00398F96EC
MHPRFVITGTDTNIGKTVFAAGLVQLLNASYWKPVQAGLEEETDSQTVRRLSQAPSNKILPEAYRLKKAASPHAAAAAEGKHIELTQLTPPAVQGPLIIEGAGGLMVPLNQQATFIDVFARWNFPLILCSKTGLGTINHTLLSIEAINRRGLSLKGIIFIGNPEPESQNIIAHLTDAPILGRLPILKPLTPQNLQQTFQKNFSSTQSPTRFLC